MFLAFVEKRTSSSDHDAELLVMRRGTLETTNIEVTYFTLNAFLHSLTLAVELLVAIKFTLCT